MVHIYIRNNCIGGGCLAHNFSRKNVDEVVLNSGAAGGWVAYRWLVEILSHIFSPALIEGPIDMDSEAQV